MANSGGLTFELNNFDQFKRELGTLSKAVDEINASLKTVKGTTDDIKPTFKNVFEEFEKFANQLKTIDIAGAANFDSFKSTVLSLKQDINESGQEIGLALIDGIESSLRSAASGQLPKTLQSMTDSIIDIVKREFGIKSPSTVFMEIGKFLMEGLTKGVQSGFGLVSSVFGKLGSLIKGTFGFGKGSGDLSNSDFNQFKDLLPLFDSLEKLETQIKSVNLSGIRESLDDLTPLVKSLRQISKELKGIDASGLSGLENLAQIIKNSAGRFANIQAPVAQFIEALPSLSLFIERYAVFARVNKGMFNRLLGLINLDVDRFLRPITNNLTGLLNLTQIISQAASSITKLDDKAETARLLNSLKSLFSFIENYSEFIGKRLSWKQWIRNIVQLDLFSILNPITSSLEGIRSLSKILAEAISSFNIVFDPAGYGKLFTGLNGLSKFFEDYAEYIGKNKGLFKRAGSLVNFDFQKALRPIVGNLSGIKNLSSILADAINNFSKIPAPENIAKLFDSLDPLLLFIKNYVKFISGQKGFFGIFSRIQGVLTLNFDKAIRPITNSLTGLRNMTKIIAEAVSNFDTVRKPEAIAKVFESLDSLIPFIEKYTAFSKKQSNVSSKIEALKNLNFAQFFRPIVGNLKGIKPLMKTLADALSNFSNVPNAQNIKRLTDSLGTVVAIIPDIANLSARLNSNSGALNKLSAIPKFLTNTELTSALKGIRPLFKLLADAVGSFSGISFTTDPSKMGEFFNGIQKFVVEINEILPTLVKTKFKIFTSVSKEFSGVKKIFKIIAEAISSFNVIQIDSSKIEAISHQTESFSKLLGVLNKEPLRNIRKDVVDNLPPIADALAKAFNKFSEIRDISSVEKISGAIRELSLGLSRLENIGAVSQIADDIGDEMPRIFKAISDGFKRSDKGQFKEAGIEIGKDILDGVEDKLEIRSPSRAMMRIGQQAIQGFVSYVKDGTTLYLAGSAAADSFMRGFALSAIKGMKDIAIKSFNSFKDSFSTIGQNLRDFGRNIFDSGRNLAIGGGIAALITGSQVSLAANFDQVLNQIRVFGKASGEELKIASDAILKFSADTIFDPAGSAQAFLGLQKAGLSLTEAIAALPSVGDLAAAGGQSLTEATDLAIRAATGFQIPFDQLNRVANAFVGAADISTASVSDLGMAIGYVANDAQALGIPIEDVATAMALLNDKAITGERAGTGLRGVFASLAAPTKEAAKALSDMGISIKDSEGNFVGLENMLMQFKTVVDDMRANGMGDVDILEQFSALGDRNATSAILALVSATEDGTLEFSNYSKALGEANTAQTIAQELMNTFAGSLDSFKGSLQTLIFKALIPVMNKGLKPLIEFGTKLLNVLIDLPEEILAIGAGVVALVAVFTTLAGVGMMIVGGVLLPLGLAFSSLATIMGVVALVFTNPLGLIAGAAAFGVGITAIIGTIAAVTGGLATLTAGLYLFIDSASKNDAVVNSFNDMRDSIGSVFTTVKDFLGAWVDLISKFDIGSSAAGTANSSFTPLVNLFNSIKDKAKELAGALSEVTTFVNLLADTYDYMNGKNNGDSPNLDRFEKEKAAIQEQIDALGELDEATASTTVTVKSGDNLTKLAEQYNTSVEAILAANEQITNPSFIRSGDEIIIPGLTATNDELERLEKKLSDVEKRERMFAEQADAMGFVSTEEQLTGLQKRVDEFSKTELGKKIFGEDADISNFITQIGRIESTFKRMGTQLGFFREGISELFTGDFSSGAKKATKSLQRLGGLFTTLIEQTTGIDISDKFQDILNEGTTKDLAKFLAEKVGELIVSGIEALVPIIQSAAKTLFVKALETLGLDNNEIERVLEFVSNVGDMFSKAFDDISAALGRIDWKNYTVFLQFFQKYLFMIAGIAAATYLVLSGALNALAPAIDVFDGLVEILYGLFNLDIDSIGDGLSKVGFGIVDIAASFAEGFIDALASLFDLIGKPEIADNLREIADNFGNFSDQIKEISDFFQNINWEELASTIWEFIKKGVDASIELVKTGDWSKFQEEIFNALKDAIGGDKNLQHLLLLGMEIWKSISASIDNAITQIETYDWAGLKTKIWGKIVEVIGEDNAAKVEEAALKIKDFIVEGLDSAAQKLGFEDVDVIKDKVSTLIKTGLSLGEDVASSIGDEIKSIFSTGISDAGLKIEGGISFDTIKNKISDAIKNININEDTISEIGTKIKDTISSGFDSASKELTDFSNNETVLAVKDKISGIVTSLFENPPTIDFNAIIQPIKDFASGLTDALGEFDLGLIDTVKNGVREVAEFFGVSEELGFDDASENINEVKEALSGMSADLAEQGIKFDFGENLALSEENIEALQFLGETFASYIAEGIGSEISLAAINSAIDSAINGIVINSTSLINQLRSVMESITALTSGGSMAFGAMKIAVSAHITSMQPVVKAFEKTIQELTFAVQKLVGAFLNAQAIVGAGDVAGAQQFQAAFNANGRAFGGTVEPNKIYEFNEERKGVPFEIFQTNGRNYLLSSEKGFMHSPLNSRPMSGGGETVIYQDYSSIQVNGSGLSREELTRAIVDAKREEQLNNPFYLRTKRAGI